MVKTGCNWFGLLCGPTWTGLEQSWSSCLKSGKSKDWLQSGCLKIGVKDRTRLDFKTLILELSPDHRYKKKHVLPSAIIPGPKKPKFIESFLSPDLHHLSALQHEGLTIWDLAHNHDFITRLFLFLACTNGPGLLTMSNFVDHQGKNGCRMCCPLKGCRKPGTSQYYPVLLKPNKYDIPGCTHNNVNVYEISPSTSEKYVQQLFYLLQAWTQKDYETCRLETDIVGPSVLLSLQP